MKGDKPTVAPRFPQTALGGLLQIALAAGPLEEKLDAALRVILDASPASPCVQGSIFLADGHADSLILAAQHRTIQIKEMCRIVPFGHCLCGQVAENRVAMAQDQSTTDGGMRRLFCTPIIEDDQLLGVLSLVMTPEVDLTSEQQEFFTLGAHSLALTISRHRSLDTKFSAKPSRGNPRELAIHDPLTGLPTLTLIRDRLEQAITSASYAQRSIGVVYLDLDNFRKINNSFGHGIGDEVLRQTGERLTDAIFNTDAIGRMGGNVFLLLLRNMRSEQDVTIVMRKLRKALEQPFKAEGHEVFVTASMGIALFPHDGEDAASLLKNANTALHKAKETGRNNYCLYSPEMNATALKRLDFESKLRKALELEQFEVHYQSQVEAASGRLVGAEALLRWRHPELGLVSPVDFIPLAEETGLIIEIGAWVLNEVCRQKRKWRDQGLTFERIAVNLSPIQFRHHDLISTVCAALLDHGLDPTLLELEITESAIMHDADKATHILQHFRDMGIRIAIDDFGTGYSSLSLLKKFPLTLLKIDRVFVNGVEQEDDDKAIVTAIIRMGQGLGLKVLAEGVETEAQRSFLHANGCNELQGYLFSRPLDVEQFTQLLSHGHHTPHLQ